MKRVTLEELEKNLPGGSYEQLCAYIYEQIKDEKIKPVKASKTNGKRPALYREYWIVEPKADYSGYIEELNYQMSTKIRVDYYLHHLEQYHKDRKWVRMLNDYLLHSPEEERAALVSMNERSFSVWGREKFLQLEQGKRILKRCGIQEGPSQLSFYETSEPLAYYSSHRRIPQNLLILENKDTFYSMRRHLQKGAETILGTAFGTLIYGAGKGILRSFQDFSFCAEPYMRAEDNRIYYFGDLDYEGIGIYERLAEAFETEHPIKPFVKAYEQMLEKARSVRELPHTKEKQNRRISQRFFSGFSKETVMEMKQILESDRYIPQEILNICDF